MTTKTRIDTTGLERAQVLAALINGTIPRGSGHRDVNARSTMTYLDAKVIIEERRVRINKHFDPEFESKRYWFDLVGGRPIMVNLEDETGFDPYDYDTNGGGSGSAQGLITRLRLIIRNQGD